MPKVISAVEFSNKPGEYTNRAVYTHERFIIQKRGKPWVIIMSAEDYEAMEDLIDTLLEQADPEFQKSLKESKTQIENGEYGTLEDIYKILKEKKRSRG